jgi:hypothetical protein
MSSSTAQERGPKGPLGPRGPAGVEGPRGPPGKSLQGFQGLPGAPAPGTPANVTATSISLIQRSGPTRLCFDLPGAINVLGMGPIVGGVMSRDDFATWSPNVVIAQGPLITSYAWGIEVCPNKNSSGQVSLDQTGLAVGDPFVVWYV